MPDIWMIALLAVSAAALLVSLLTLRRVAAADSAPVQRLDALERQLGERFASAVADLAARLERTRGDVRQELADRLAAALGELRAALDAQLATGREEQGRRLGEMVARLETKFDGLSATQTQGLTATRQELTAALVGVTRSLEEKFANLEQRTTANLESIRARVDERLLAITQQVQTKLEQNIKEGVAQFEKVREHLRAAEEQLRQVGALGQSVNDLNNLLKLPHLRGAIGEERLEMLLADFLPADLYELQAAVGPDGVGRPDAVLKLPNAPLPIDSKFPREQILPLFESSDPAVLADARTQLERVVKEQGRKITKYLSPGTADVALMFLPSETLWFEVVRSRDLMQALRDLRVFPVSPNTLVLVLHTARLAHTWFKIAAGFAQTRVELAKAMKSFDYFQAQFDTVGRSIDKAQEAFTTARGHLSRYQTRVAGLVGDAVTVDAAGLTSPHHGEPVPPQPAIQAPPRFPTEAT